MFVCLGQGRVSFDIICILLSVFFQPFPAAVSKARGLTSCVRENMVGFRYHLTFIDEVAEPPEVRAKSAPPRLNLWLQFWFNFKKYGQFLTSF